MNDVGGGRWAKALRAGETEAGFTRFVTETDVFGGLVPSADWQEHFDLLTRTPVAHATRLVAEHEVLGNEALAKWSEELSVALRDITVRTLVRELHDARGAGRLRASTSRARFAEFTDSLRRPEVRDEIWARYPVLARRVGTLCRQWAESTGELVQRWSADKPQVRAQLLAGADPQLLAITRSGDPHADGRTVCVLEFTDGQRVVYKPRSIEVLTAYDNFLQEHAARSGLEQRSPNHVARDGYGWVEFVEHTPCADMAAVRDFYRRLGSQLAVLQLMQAVDMHFENVVACGAFPVVIDHETLFHVGRVSSEGSGSASRLLEDSVLRTGLMPVPLLGEQAQPDISGIGGEAGQQLPNLLVEWAGAGTDEMRLVRRPGVTAAQQNQPYTADGRVDPTVFTEAVLEGYRIGRSALPSGEHARSALRRLSACPTRMVLRPTGHYARYLDEADHPDLLTDISRYDRFLEQAVATHPHPAVSANVREGELAALRAGSVPLFTGAPGSVELHAYPDLMMCDALREPPLRTALAAHAAHAGTDRGANEWLIRATMASRQSQVVHGGGDTCPPGDGEVASVEELSAARARIDRQLCDLAVGDARADWLALEPIDGYWAVRPIGIGLSHGILGPALYFAHKGALAGDAAVLRTASRLAASTVPVLQAALSRRDEAAVVGGGFDGWGGVAHALHCVAGLTGSGAGCELSRQLLGDQLHSAEDVTYSRGLAGALTAAVSIGVREFAAADLRRAADRLLAHQWRGYDFARGAAGAAWAVAAYADCVDDQKLRGRAVALAARTGPADSTPGGGWCRGRAGQQLCRLLTDRPKGDLAVDPATGSLGDSSMCHGLAGLIDTRLRLGHDDPLIAAHGKRLGARLAHRILEQGAQCDTPGWVATPGLMRGLAGIGMGLLRAADPHVVAPVLTLGT